MSQCYAVDYRNRPSFEHILKVMNADLEDWTAEVNDFNTTNEEGKGTDTENIKSRKGNIVFKIKARKDRHTLDLYTRLVKPEGGVERKHDSSIV